MKWIYKKINHKKDNINIEWEITLPDGEVVIWKGLSAGPLTLTETELTTLCQDLLGIELDKLADLAEQVLQPVSAATTIDKSLILHSATPDLGAFEGDFTKIKEGKFPKNYTGYVETRATYLGKEKDMAVGRMTAWKTAMSRTLLEKVEVPNLDYYYLSHFLLKLAKTHQDNSDTVLSKVINYLKEHPTTLVRLYVLDQPIQLFLVWLQRVTGLPKIYIDANSPAVSRVWNNKNILYPTVAAAQSITIEPTASAYEVLEQERKHNLFYQKLGLNLPTLPGYTIKRQGHTPTEFTAQLIDAAQLLQTRYGLNKGCLKAAEAGDGARITPNVILADKLVLEQLAQAAYTHGDDYVLECNFEYAATQIGEDLVKLTPSAHIRSGELAPGITLQFKKGTSWMGNVFVHENLAEQLGISIQQYQTIRHTLAVFLAAFQKQNLGLTIAGIDFAIGQIGGKFGTDTLLAIQDPNISFNGAEFLRVFMRNTSKALNRPQEEVFAITWVFVPSDNCTYKQIEAIFSTQLDENVYCEIVTLIPNSWGMLGIASLDFEICVEQLAVLKKAVLLLG